MNKRLFTLAGVMLCAIIASASVLTVKNRAGAAPNATTMRAKPSQGVEVQTASPAPVSANLPGEAKPTGESVPDHVVYWHLFHHNNLLVKKSEETERLGNDATFTRDFYKREAKLDDAQAMMFSEIAASCEREVNVVDAEAKLIIDAFRAKHPSGQLQPGETLPPPPPELQALQQRRNNAVLQARDRLQQVLGTTAFENFEKFVHEKVAPQIKPKAFSALRPAMPAGEQRQPQTIPYKGRQ